MDSEQPVDPHQYVVIHTYWYLALGSRKLTHIKRPSTSILRPDLSCRNVIPGFLYIGRPRRPMLGLFLETRSASLQPFQERAWDVVVYETDRSIGCLFIYNGRNIKGTLMVYCLSTRLYKLKETIQNMFLIIAVWLPVQRSLSHWPRMKQY